MTTSKKAKKYVALLLFYVPVTFGSGLIIMDMILNLKYDFLNDLEYNFLGGPGTGSEPVILRLRINLTYVRP